MRKINKGKTLFYFLAILLHYHYNYANCWLSYHTVPDKEFCNIAHLSKSSYSTEFQGLPTLRRKCGPHFQTKNILKLHFDIIYIRKLCLKTTPRTGQRVSAGQIRLAGRSFPSHGLNPTKLSFFRFSNFRC